MGNVNWEEGGIRPSTRADQIRAAQEAIEFWERQINGACLQLIKETPKGSYQISIYQQKKRVQERLIKKLQRRQPKIT